MAKSVDPGQTAPLEASWLKSSLFAQACLSTIFDPNYHTYSYKRTVKQFLSLQITASVIFVYFFIKAYVVGTHLNCINLPMQFKWVPTTYAFKKKIRKKKKKYNNITLASFTDLCLSVPLV